MAEAQSAVDEDLRLYRRVLRDKFYLLKAELARQNGAGQPHLGRGLNAGKVVYAHLRARVQRDIWNGPFQNTQKSDILNQYCVRSKVRYAPGKLGGLLHLTVANKRVHRDIDLAAAYAAVPHRLFKFLVAEILRSAASIEYSQSHIDRIRAVLYGGNDRLRRACG